MCNCVCVCDMNTFVVWASSYMCHVSRAKCSWCYETTLHVDSEVSEHAAVTSWHWWVSIYGSTSPDIWSLPPPSTNMRCCCQFVLRNVFMFVSERPLPSGPDCLLSKDVMGCREEAKFNHNSSHDRSTNAAIQQWLSLKQTYFTVHVHPV